MAYENDNHLLIAYNGKYQSVRDYLLYGTDVQKSERKKKEEKPNEGSRIILCRLWWAAIYYTVARSMSLFTRAWQTKWKV